MLNRIIYGDDIFAHAKSLAIKALYIKWKTLSQLKRLTLTDFLDSDEKVSSNFLIMLHTGNDDYAVIYHGSEHRKAFGQDLSGQVLSQASGRIGRDVRPIYDQVRESGIPVRIIYASEGTQAAAGWERIILPLKIAGEIRILVCYSEALTLASEVHGFLFDNSPHMLIVALPISAFDDVVDADIIQINPTAAQFFGIGPSTDLPVRLRQLKPWFNDDETWQVLTSKGAGSRGCTLAGRGKDQTFNCLLVQREHLLVFRIYLIDAPEMVTID
jgi:PAS domain-containing protein